jgi:transcriptional regulator with XRE-family HTH domain
MTIQFSKLWDRLGASRPYRNQFVSAQAGRAFAFQLRAIMKKRGITQEELAGRSGLTQGVVSRAADPNYGKLTTTVKVKIANGLDMAYLGVLVPFGEATKWFSNLSEESVQVKTFDEEANARAQSPLVSRGFSFGVEESNDEFAPMQWSKAADLPNQMNSMGIGTKSGNNLALNAAGRL